MNVIYCLILLLVKVDDVPLPRWMTPEESLRGIEIVRRYTVTVPPDGWVETPAEFEELKGVFMTWWWDNYFNEIFREIVREVVEGSKAYIIVKDVSEQTTVTNYLIAGGVPLDSIGFYIYPRNSIWIRDYGPIFIHEENNDEGIIDFRYYPMRPDDDTIPWRIGDDWGIPVYGSPLRHYGGNFMVDGLGTGFASTLIYENNSSYSPEEIDTIMREYNGLEQFIVLPRINIEMTGHIDLWAKILNDTLVMVGEYAPGHPNYEVLNENADSISRCKNCEGYPYRVVRMPMPWSTTGAPPSYLNSLFVNGKILVPLCDELEDDTALFIYQQVLPDYEIIGIDCSEMLGWGGAIHCITMQVPLAEFLCINHVPLDDTEDTLNPYRVRAQIMSSSSLISDSTSIIYAVNSGPFDTIPLSVVPDTQFVYEGYMPAQSSGDTVYYYILSRNTDGVRRTSPLHAPLQIYSFLLLGTNINESSTLSMGMHEFAVYPNPTQHKVIFQFGITEPTNITITIYNICGQKVKRVDHKMQSSGNYTFQWNFTDDNNRTLPQGIYFYRVLGNSETMTGKILLIK